MALPKYGRGPVLNDSIFISQKRVQEWLLCRGCICSFLALKAGLEYSEFLAPDPELGPEGPEPGPFAEGRGLVFQRLNLTAQA